VGGACCYDCSCGCFCLELQLESAEAAVRPGRILERRLPPPGQRGFPSPWKARTPPRLSQHASASGLEPRSVCAAWDSRLRANDGPLPPPSVGHNCQGDLPNRISSRHRTTEQPLTKLPCPRDKNEIQLRKLPLLELTPESRRIRKKFGSVVYISEL
jgi:hypothetical protein